MNTPDEASTGGEAPNARTASPEDSDADQSGGSWLDRLVGVLADRGVTPNMISWAGFVCACGAAICLSQGAGNALPFDRGHADGPTSWWPFAAAMFLAVASAADLLDGALARRRDLMTPYGALLDSTLDRASDMALFSGCAIYFAAAENLTYVALSSAALAAAVLTSYVKARGENMTKNLGVGYWQRGERLACFGVGAVSGHVPAALWILGTFPFITVAKRLAAARRGLEGEPEPPPPSWWQLWRQSRRSLSYRAVAVAITLAIVLSPWFLPFFRGLSDPLAALIGRPV